MPFEQGLAELAEWLEGQAATDRFDEAAAELDRRGIDGLVDTVEPWPPELPPPFAPET